MNLVKVFYPFSVYTIVSIVILGLCAVSLWSVTIGFCIAFAGWTGILRITPILDWLERQIPSAWTSQLSTNLQVSFPFHGSTSTQGLYVWHPHGVLITSMTYHVLHKTIPNMKGACHWSYTLVPFMRELMDKYGVINASYPEMKTSLQESQSVSVALGGMREIWTTRPNEMHLHISRKRGIFRLALETGVPLIPVLVYGENELFEHIPFEFNQWLFDNTGWFLPIPTLHSIGRWWDLLQGRGQPVVAHSGDPIEVSQCSHPTEKDIHSLRTTYIEAVKALYEKTRPSHYAASLTIF